MKLSYNWLKEYLKCDLTPQEVADAMTAIGIEVDGVEEQEQIPGGLTGVVVARVLTCEAHPDSDHLHVTTVDAGAGEPVTVVCGAPNVAAGQKVLFAQIGTVLPGDFKIKKSRIRGVAMATCTFALWVGCCTLTFSFPSMNATLGSSGTFWIYSFICAFAFMFLWRNCPETKGRELED